MEAWEDDTRTPDNKVQTIKLYAFGVKASPSQGIMVSSDSLLVAVDGAGRTSTAIEELNRLRREEADLDDHICVRRNMQFQLNINLSGDTKQALMEFLSENRDPKKVSNNTNLAAENALLALMEEDQIDEIDYDHPLWVVRVINSLNHAERSGTFLNFVSWAIEGKRQKRDLRKKASTYGSLASAIKKVLPLIKARNIPINELPDVISFGLRQWYELCPEVVGDLQSGKSSRYRPNGEELMPRTVSTLGLQVMIYISVAIYRVTGSDELRFREMVKRVIQQHFAFYKDEHYLTPKQTKKMTPNEFWYQNRLMAEKIFNSGMANTELMFKQLEPCVNSVLAREPR